MAIAASISDLLQERIEAGDFPSAVYLVAEKGDIILHDALGYTVVEPERIEARLDTIYDLASLTKVLVTGLLAAKLIERSQLSLDDAISGCLPAFDTDEKRRITVKNLLAHTSGLTAWLPMYLLADRPEEVIDVIADHPLEYATGSKVLYSDLNFLGLQAIVEKIAGDPLDALAQREIFRPLDLKDTAFDPEMTLRPRIAASENGSGFERQMSVEKGHGVPPAPRVPSFRNGTERNLPFRQGVIWGEVHDGNAYFMGGVAGHAGLFSSAEEVFKIAQQFLPSYTTLLKPETCEFFRTNFTAGVTEHRSFAFQLASTSDSTAGARMSPQSFGHNGFTGTSLWIDSDQKRVFVLLTNRTHNREVPFANIHAVRRRFHDLAVEHLDKIS